MQQAQAGLMSGLNSQQRREMYTKISDDSLAGLLVVMRFPERLKMLREVEQVDQALVDRVLRYIRYTFTEFAELRGRTIVSMQVAFGWMQQQCL